MIGVDQLTAFIERTQCPFWLVKEFGTNTLLDQNRDIAETGASITRITESLESLEGYGRVTVTIADEKGKSGNFANCKRYNVRLNGGNASAAQAQLAMPPGAVTPEYLKLFEEKMKLEFEVERQKNQTPETNIEALGKIIDKFATAWGKMQLPSGSTDNNYQLGDIKVLIENFDEWKDNDNHAEIWEQKFEKDLPRKLSELCTKVDVRAIERLIDVLNDQPQHVITALKKLE